MPSSHDGISRHDSKDGSDSPRVRALLLSLFGVAVLTNALSVHALALGQPVTGYERTTLTFAADGGVESSGEIPNRIEGVDCYLAEEADERHCLLESWLLSNSTAGAPDGTPTNVTVPAPSGYDPPDEQYTYHDGQFYRRTLVTQPDANASIPRGELRLAFRPVPTDAVLAEVAVPQADLSDPASRALRSGSVRTGHELRHVNRLITTDDGYAMVLAGTRYDSRLTPYVGTGGSLAVRGVWLLVQLVIGYLAVAFGVDQFRSTS